MNRRIIVAAAILYPFGIYFGIAYLPPFAVTGLVIGFIAIRFLLNDFSLQWKLLGGAVILLLVGMHWFMKDDYGSLRFYPVIVNLVMLIIFSVSLFRGTPLIETIARKRGMEVGAHNMTYLRNLTFIWVLFFIFNIIVSLWTAMYANMDTWLLYNGFIVYVLMACMAVSELIFRRYYKRRQSRKSV